MRRLADELVLSLKDQIRTFRYSLRSEAQAPGSALPEAYRNVDFGPLGTVGAMFGTPVVRMADGLFSQVEQVTQGLFEGAQTPTPFPRPVSDYFGRPGAETDFTHELYEATKTLLANHGARQALVSEHAIDDLRNEVIARHRDLVWTAGRFRAGSDPSQRGNAVQLCAAIAAGFARLRPIQKLDLTGSREMAGQVLIAPNAYCGLVFGLSMAIVTVRASADELAGIEALESADAVVNARFDRLKRALDGKDASATLAREFEAVLPFLP